MSKVINHEDQTKSLSKVVLAAMEGVADSEFYIDPNTGLIEIRNAQIFWTNFEGRMDNWGNTARNFNVAVSAEMADILSANGWRIREYGNEEQGMLYFVNVKVNMNSKYPPVITVFSVFKDKRSRTPLTVDTLLELDRMDIESADLIVNPYKSPKGEGKVTGYLRTLNVIKEPDIIFGGKYDDWENEDIPLDEQDEEAPF